MSEDLCIKATVFKAPGHFFMVDVHFLYKCKNNASIGKI